jgi:hypothetical protein
MALANQIWVIGFSRGRSMELALESRLNPQAESQRYG